MLTIWRVSFWKLSSGIGGWLLTFEFTSNCCRASMLPCTLTMLKVQSSWRACSGERPHLVMTKPENLQIQPAPRYHTQWCSHSSADSPGARTLVFAAFLIISSCAFSGVISANTLSCDTLALSHKSRQSSLGRHTESHRF